jgi:pimeloyl-[acyl-carrier protein] methyl ester esterase
MDGTGELFSEFAAALPREFETATARYPTERCLSNSELEGFVRAVCPTSGSFVLLAESYSTPLAIKYAVSNPENLEGLVLCAGFATSPVQGWRRFLGPWGDCSRRSCSVSHSQTLPPSSGLSDPMRRLRCWR